MSLIINGLSGLPKFNSLKQDKIILCYISIKEDNTADLNFAGSVFPIKTLQKHGRLIDVDSLVDKIESDYCDKCNAIEECGVCVCQNCNVDVLFDLLDNAPTIIESEE